MGGTRKETDDVRSSKSVVKSRRVPCESDPRAGVKRNRLIRMVE